MFLLDTNIASLLFRSAFPADVLLEHLNTAGRENVYLSSVTYEEFVQGALAVIRQTETKRQSTVPGYLLLTRQIEFLASFPLLEFDATAESLFAGFPLSYDVQETLTARLQPVPFVMARPLSHKTCDIFPLFQS